jgi:argininosuccinate synthase
VPLARYAFYCEDIKKEFVTDFVFRMLKTSALYEGPAAGPAHPSDPENHRH